MENLNASKLAGQSTLLTQPQQPFLTKIDKEGDRHCWTLLLQKHQLNSKVRLLIATCSVSKYSTQPSALTQTLKGQMHKSSLDTIDSKTPLEIRRSASKFQPAPVSKHFPNHKPIASHRPKPIAQKMAQRPGFLISTCSIFQLEAWPTPIHNQQLNKTLQNQNQEELVKHCYETATKRLQRPNLLNTFQPTQTLKTKTKMPHPTLVTIATKIL